MSKKPGVVVAVVVGSLIALMGSRYQQERPFERMATSEQIKIIQQRLAHVKKKLSDEGMYGCCIKGSCNWCLLNPGTCPCGSDWMEKKPLCNECDFHWQRGDSLTGWKSYADRDSMIQSFQSGH